MRRTSHPKLFHNRLLVVTVLVAVCAEFLVSAIEDVVEQWHISETFVGLILLPIVGNAAEHVTAVTVAMKNKVKRNWTFIFSDPSILRKRFDILDGPCTRRCSRKQYADRSSGHSSHGDHRLGYQRRNVIVFQCI